MSACPHTPAYPDPLAVPSFEECKSRCKVVEGDEHVAKNRALTAADGMSTKIDAAYWQNLSEIEKTAVIAHERGHPGIGMKVNCEGCADKMGGYYMRSWGFSPGAVRAAYVALKVNRKPGEGAIADNAVSGARAAEQALAGRGLLGLSSLSLAQARATETLRLAKVPTAAAPSAQLTAAAGIDPGGPTTSLNASGTANTPNGGTSANVVTSPSTTNTDPLGSSFAGDAVSAVLGEDARPHTGKVLIAAGIAATLALILVVVVRHATKGE